MRREGWEFRIYFRDHEPAHVHVAKADAEMVLVLEDPVEVRGVHGAWNIGDVRRTIEITQQSLDELRARWKEIQSR